MLILEAEQHVAHLKLKYRLKDTVVLVEIYDATMNQWHTLTMDVREFTEFAAFFDKIADNLPEAPYA